MARLTFHHVTSLYRAWNRTSVAKERPPPLLVSQTIGCNRADSRRSRQLQWPFTNAHVYAMNLHEREWDTERVCPRPSSLLPVQTIWFPIFSAALICTSTELRNNVNKKQRINYAWKIFLENYRTNCNTGSNSLASDKV